MSSKSTRAHIVEAADTLFYERGFAHTTFSDVAAAVGISRGNFYHHFKTKDAILEAVLTRRIGATRAMLDAWEAESANPGDRVRLFVRILVRNREAIARFGCPVGTLTSELAKLDHASRQEAAALFTLFRRWLRRQFELLGRERDADALAMHVLARSQGVATLANALGDQAFVDREVQQMCAWVDAIEAAPDTNTEMR